MSGGKGVPKSKWSEDEEDALKTGVERYGPGKWRMIQKDDELSPFLKHRSNVDLKDKWRNLTVGSNPSSTPAKPKKERKSEEEPVDAGKPLSKQKLQSLIVQAVTTLKDKNGTGVPAILKFVEHNCGQAKLPQPIKKQVADLLNTLVTQNSLVKQRGLFKIAVQEQEDKRAKRASKEPKECKETNEPKETKDPKESKETNEPKEAKVAKVAKEAKAEAAEALPARTRGRPRKDAASASDATDTPTESRDSASKTVDKPDLDALGLAEMKEHIEHKQQEVAHMKGRTRGNTALSTATHALQAALAAVMDAEECRLIAASAAKEAESAEKEAQEAAAVADAAAHAVLGK